MVTWGRQWLGAHLPFHPTFLCYRAKKAQVTFPRRPCSEGSTCDLGSANQTHLGKCMWQVKMRQGLHFCCFCSFSLWSSICKEAPYSKEPRPHHLTAVDLAAVAFTTLLIVAEVGVPLAGQFCSVVMGVISGDPAKGLFFSSFQ